MSSVEGAPGPAEISELYYATANLAVVFGGPARGTELAVASGPLDPNLLPDVVKRRFPPGLVDCTGHCTLRAAHSENIDREPPLRAELQFQRATVPDDPAFQQNSWSVAYDMHGASSNHLAVNVDLTGRRSHTPPPEDVPSDPKAAREYAAKLLGGRMADWEVDEATARLPIPEGMQQPQLLADEVRELAHFTKFILHRLRILPGRQT